MSHKYIRENKNSFAIVKSSRNYGKFKNIDEALFIRDLLIQNDWQIGELDDVYEFNNDYLIVKAIDEKLHILARYSKKPSQKAVDELYKRHLRNPNNSKYGLNITRIFDTFIIKKQIAGDDYIFGYYDKMEDAEFVRNFLLDNHWNVNEFSQIEYDEETKLFWVIEVIDDKAYVLGSFKTKQAIDLDKCHQEFLRKISKHKFGLASHPHLDELTDKLSQLEDKFNIKASDTVWSFNNVQDPLNDIIFNLTPFQKSVYDAVDNSTFDDIKKSLVRFKSKNFDEKIRKNIDELIKLDLITMNGNYYIHKNQK